MRSHTLTHSLSRTHTHSFSRTHTKAETRDKGGVGGAGLEVVAGDDHIPHELQPLPPLRVLQLEVDHLCACACACACVRLRLCVCVLE